MMRVKIEINGEYLKIRELKRIAFNMYQMLKNKRNKMKKFCVSVRI